MSLQKSVRAAAAAAALTLAVAVPAIAEPEDSTAPSAFDGVAATRVAEGDDADGDDADGEESGAQEDGGEATPGSDDATDDKGADEGAAEGIIVDGASEAAGESRISPFALPAAGEEDVTFRIANITDFHGRLGEYDRDGTTLIGPGLGLACYVDANPDAFLTSSGDNIGATLFVSAAQDDTPTLDFLETYGVKVSALGNHELDRGWADFDAKADYASFPYLAANLTGPETGSLGDYEIVTIDGVDVAFVGAVTASLRSLISPSIIDGNDLVPIEPVVSGVADALKDGDPANGEADVVVALVHEDPGVYIGDLSGNVDIVFGGHSHLQFNNGQTAPTLAMQAASYGTHVAQVDVTIDSEGELTFVPELVPIGSNAAAVAGCDGSVANQIRSQLADALAEANSIGSQPLGYIADDFKRAFAAPGSESRGEESTVGSLVADAQLWAGQQTPVGEDATISFMNPGGLRTDLLYGDDGLITLGKAATMQPFANTLFAMTLTGQDIVDILEQQKQPSGVERPYLKMGVAGLSYTYDPETYEVVDVWLDSGEEFSREGTYRIITNSFLKDGGDNFPAFLNGTEVQDTGLVDLNAFIDFMDEFAPQGDPLDPHGSVYGPQRSWGITEVTPLIDEIVAGDEIALEYAGLWYTNGEPSNVTELSVFLAGESLGTFAVTGSQADLDARMTNYGRAEVRAEAPSLQEFAGADIALQVFAGDQLLSEWTYSIPTIPAVAPSESDLDPELEGAITVPASAEPGDSIPVEIPGAGVGTEVGVWLFSTPVYLGTHTVGADGTVTVVIPADAELRVHTIGVWAGSGDQIGWARIEIAEATDEPTDGSTDGSTDDSTDDSTDTSTPATPGGKTPDTGLDIGQPLLAAMLLLGMGAIALGMRRKMIG